MCPDLAIAFLNCFLSVALLAFFFLDDELGKFSSRRTVFFAFSTERAQQEIDILHSLQSLMHIPLPAEEGNDQSDC